MSYITVFPLPNSIKFYDQNPEYPLTYNFRHFESSYAEQVRTNAPINVRMPYYQKLQHNDTVTIYVDVQHGAGVNLQLFTTAGVQTGTDIPGYTSGVFPNNTQNGVQMDTYVFSFAVSAYTSGADGTYFLVFSNVTSVGNAYYQSEPLLIRTTHKKTLLFKYSNNTSKNGLIVSGALSPYAFYKRIDGDIRTYKPYANAVTYKDQEFDQQNLKLVGWRGFTLSIGGRKGVPAYEVDRMSQLFTCDNILIDGKAFVYDNESSGGGGNSGSTLWDVKDGTTTPLVVATLPVTEKNNTVGAVFNKATKFFLFSSPQTYPYAVCPSAGLLMTGPSGSVYTPAKIVEDAGGEATYLSFLNGDVAANNGLTGLFIYDSGDYFYQNGEGENYGAGNTVYTYTGLLTLGVNGTNNVVSGTTFKFTFGNGAIITDFGAAPLYSQVKLVEGAGNHTLTQTYSVSATLPNGIRLFHDQNSINYVSSLNFTGTSVIITAFSGNVPKSLINFVCQNQNLGSFTPTIIGAAHGNLTTFNVSLNNITSLTSTVFSANSFYNLNYINVFGNKISTTQIDSLFNNVVTPNGLALPVFGHFTTIGQNPVAPPTSSSLSARQYLVNIKGWTLSTD